MLGYCLHHFPNINPTSGLNAQCFSMTLKTYCAALNPHNFLLVDIRCDTMLVRSCTGVTEGGPTLSRHWDGVTTAEKNILRFCYKHYKPSLNVKALREVGLYSGWREKVIWSGGSFNDRRSLKSLLYYSID